MKARTKPNWHCPSCGTPRLLNPAELEKALENKRTCRRCLQKKRQADGKYTKETT